jgi:quercetin dioxygenase-like cupin family protein
MNTSVKCSHLEHPTGMADTTVTKVDSAYSPKGPRGQKYLASGKTVSMRLWDEEPGGKEPEQVSRSYEVVGYVLEGAADLEIEGQLVKLKAGDSWVVPKGARHSYRIKQHFKAVEATSPPAQVHGRDE